MALLILGLIGLAIGIWLGLPGRYQQTPEDIDRLMERGGGTRRRRPKRSISPIAWLQRKLSPGRAPPSRRRGFRMEAPGEPGGRASRAAPPRVSQPTPEPAADESRRPSKRTRNNLREGRFKLRHPEEGSRS
jgi:hypothetical protein